MPALWKPGLALLALSIAGPLWAQPPAPEALIDRCSGAGSTLTGISALSKACPGVDEALNRLGLTALLPSGWSKALTASGLADLGALVKRYSGSPPSQPPASAALRSIAAALIPPSPPPTWTQRLAKRINLWTIALLHRVGRWLRSLGPVAGHSALVQAMITCLAALLIATVLVLVFVLAGTRTTRRWRAPAPAGRAGLAAGVTDPAAAQSAEPDWTQLRASPARILRLLVEALTRSHRLERDRHLTCRELEAQARLDDERERANFARVTRLAEREIYGPPGGHLIPEEILREMKTLHARLCAAAGNAGENRR
jgi:hypothetical protein